MRDVTGGCGRLGHRPHGYCAAGTCKYRLVLRTTWQRTALQHGRCPTAVGHEGALGKGAFALGDGVRLQSVCTRTITPVHRSQVLARRGRSYRSGMVGSMHHGHDHDVVVCSNHAAACVWRHRNRIVARLPCCVDVYKRHDANKSTVQYCTETGKQPSCTVISVGILRCTACVLELRMLAIIFIKTSSLKLPVQ